MAKPYYSWSAEVESRIVTAIRNGAYPIVAAEVNGIPREVFAEWIRRGEGKHTSQRWRALGARIREAIAYARLKAEAESLRQDSRTWLKHGPGREMQETPGWSQAVKPCGDDSLEKLAEGALSMDRLSNVIPELGQVPTVTREVLITLLNQGRQRA
jgi:hypothetical protein